MRQRKSSGANAFGVAALDMFSGLFGLLIILYVQTERFSGISDSEADQLSLVEVQAASGFSGELGLTFHVDTTLVTSWPDCPEVPGVFWLTCQSNNLAAVIEDGEPKGPYAVILRSHPDGLHRLSDTISVALTTPELADTLELTRTNFFIGDL